VTPTKSQGSNDNCCGCCFTELKACLQQWDVVQYVHVQYIPLCMRTCARCIQSWTVWYFHCGTIMLRISMWRTAVTPTMPPMYQRIAQPSLHMHIFTCRVQPSAKVGMVTREEWFLTLVIQASAMLFYNQYTAMLLYWRPMECTVLPTHGQLIWLIKAVQMPALFVFLDISLNAARHTDQISSL
jgi:hypothetical protein